MAINNRHRVGVQAIKSVQQYVAGEDIPAGSLVHIDATDGKIYLADATTGKQAHGFILMGSIKSIDEAIQDNRESILEAGDRADVEHFMAFTSDEGYDIADLGKPVYLGAGGVFTLTEPTTSGHIKQIVGFVNDRRIAILSLLEGNRLFTVIA